MGSKHLLLRFLLGCGGGTVTPSPPGKGGCRKWVWSLLATADF